MLKKRVIGVVTVKDSWCVQSVGYKDYLPLGEPKYQVENLNRWCVDEILVNCIDRTKNNLKPDFDCLKEFQSLGISTPIIFSGGISTKEDAILSIKYGADRVLIDQGIYKGANNLKEISEAIGKQAIILNSPVKLIKNKLMHFNYLNKEEIDFDFWCKKYLNKKFYSELMLSDVDNEGLKGLINKEIISNLKEETNPLILFGGINDPSKIEELLENEKVAAIAIGNCLSFKENIYLEIKNKIHSRFVRKDCWFEKKSFI